MTIELNESNFEAEVLSASQPVLVDFWAPWCGPCRSMAPVIDDLSKEYNGKVKIAKLNVDENQSLAASYGIMSIPTMLIFKEGKVMGQIVGYTPKNVLAKKIEAVMEG